MIKVGSDFSGVGAFNQALIRLGIPFKEIFACDMDKYARQTFIHNYGEPDYYPTNVYNREIPAEPLDIYMTSPPCQAFSLAGKRLGKEDQRGILFFNSHEFIKVNKPRFFIFENVKGLLSDDNGNTFNEWVNLLAGKSVNGLPVMFPYEDSVPYHLYWKVINAKHHGVPQNRERVFLIGIRDDNDNVFRFPIEEHLTKRLKDVLENDVDEKYYLSEKAIEGITNTTFCSRSNLLQEKDYSDCILSRDYKDAKCVKVKSATSKGYEEASEGDSINFSVPFSETRRGRVGKGVAQTLDTACNQGVMIYKEYRTEEAKKKRKETGTNDFRDKKCGFFEQDYANTLTNVQKDNLLISDYRIRRLTPRECFRLMDFPDTFTWPVSDSQAYKQAGNSIVVNVLYKILKNLPL